MKKKQSRSKRLNAKQATNLTIHDRILEIGQALMDARGYTSLSVLVEELIRNEYEKRCGPMATCYQIQPDTRALLNEPANSGEGAEVEKIVGAVEAEANAKRTPESDKQ